MSKLKGHMLGKTEKAVLPLMSQHKMEFDDKKGLIGQVH